MGNHLCSAASAASFLVFLCNAFSFLLR